MAGMTAAAPAIASSIPTIMSAVSTGTTAASQVAAGDAKMLVAQRKAQELEFEAGQLDTNAGQQRAVAQRNAQQETDNAALLNSRALAVAAASGGGASDPTIVNLMARIAAQGQFKAMTALYEGETQARATESAASARRFQAGTTLADGSVAQGAAAAAGFSTILSGGAKAGATLFTKYFSGDTMKSSPGAAFGGTDNSQAASGGDFTINPSFSID